MSKRDPNLYLDDIKDSILKIEEYIEGLTFEKFRSDQKVIDAVVRNFEVIGEAAANMPEEVKKQYPAVPWSDMIGTRNKIIHEYFGVDKEIIWDTAKRNIPELKKEIEKIIIN